jgi:hypothetical protein
LKGVDAQELLSLHNKTLSQNGLVESAHTQDDLPESVSTLSGEISDLEEEELTNPTEDEEAEMRRTVQALFQLEEELLNQHMSNIQVSIRKYLFLFD